ncbi:Med5-domain-containing protein [Microstroma glucosiphilum]|uniref:Mediator of RNA polymerase II transcription subunit 5 n=1 Tax=Pseudomicrostroma glucosiphilum TaxID=1684307 RepID=A0A316UCQ6_9BASI|nr:Med5-domain-containing protein [Pseudomicrostroma glucosiphilum]PWN22614.1 Med5-domain-containing protein [Pseudomicrostroma glucosiphilum]
MIEESTCAKDAGAALIECFKTSTTVATASLDALSLVVLALLEQPAALHIILLFTSANELGAPLRCVLTDEEVIDNLCGPGVGGDDESGMLSRVVLFIQWLAQLSFQSEEQGHGLDSDSKEFNSSVSPSASRAYALRDLTEDESPLVSRWISELFDSDGIGDEIIRDSPPRILIKLAPTLLHQSILAAEQGVIDVEMLKGGCSFFLQDLLSYTLPSGLVWLMRDLERIGGVHQSRRGAQGTALGTGTPSRSSLLVTLLSMFLLDEGCPPVVLELVRPHFERLQSYEGSGQALMDTSTLEALRSRFEREETKGLRE